MFFLLFILHHRRWSKSESISFLSSVGYLPLDCTHRSIILKRDQRWSQGGRGAGGRGRGQGGRGEMGGIKQHSLEKITKKRINKNAIKPNNMFLRKKHISKTLENLMDVYELEWNEWWTKSQQLFHTKYESPSIIEIFIHLEKAP